MPRLDLNVPFSEKDDAKKLGAKWDPKEKTWYVPDGVEAGKFEKWLPIEKGSAIVESEPEDPLIQVLCEGIHIAETHKSCWQCHQESPVYGILLLPHYDIDSEHGETDKYLEEIRKEQTPVFMCYSTDLSKDIQAAIRTLTPLFKTDYSKTFQGSYWMNHCKNCGAKLGDFNVFDDGGPFDIKSPQQAEKITVHSFDGRLLNRQAECKHIAEAKFIERAKVLHHPKPMESP